MNPITQTDIDNARRLVNSIAECAGERYAAADNIAAELDAFLRNLQPTGKELLPQTATGIVYNSDFLDGLRQELDSIRLLCDGYGLTAKREVVARTQTALYLYAESLRKYQQENPQKEEERPKSTLLSNLG